MKNVIRKHIKFLIVCVLFIFVAGFAGTYIQFLKGELLDAALLGINSGVLRLAIMFFASIVLEITAYYGYDYFRSRFSVANKKTLREYFFKWLLGRSPVDIMTMPQGEFLAQYTDQLDQINDSFLDNIPLLIEILSKMVIVSAALFWLDYRIALFTLFLLTMPLYVPKLIEKRLQRAKTESIESFQKHLGRIAEWLSGFELIKNYSIENIILQKFRNSNSETADKSFDFKKVTYLSKTITALLSYMSHFAVIAATAALVLSGDFSAGDFFIAVGLIDQLSYPIIAVFNYLQELIGTKPLVKKFDFMFAQASSSHRSSKETMTHDGLNSLNNFNKINSIAFKNVCFEYKSGEPVLKNFSLTVDAGEKCLIMGQSGSGKSTSMNLLLGYYEPQSGEISVNGMKVSSINKLNENIAVMRQDPVLFNDTLRNNITMYNSRIDDSNIISLLERLNLNKFANKDGLDSIILEGGSNLSGGERKRIALARTLLRNAPITIIDEPLANVDAETAEMIEDILIEPTDGIMFVITHQFSKDKRSAFKKQATL